MQAPSTPVPTHIPRTPTSTTRHLMRRGRGRLGAPPSRAGSTTGGPSRSGRAGASSPTAATQRATGDGAPT
eukprot:14063066-Alexandrium_andersonii.AAC.1